MPWKEQNVVNLRTEFVFRLLGEGISMSDLCREYGISRKTGYKWKERFHPKGISGMYDESRRPSASPGEISERVVCEIVRLKHAHMRWGPRKIRALYARTHPGEAVPSDSTFKRILDKAGLVTRRKRRRVTPGERIVSGIKAEEPNDVWTVDFKGWWYTPWGTRCEPLTVRDAYSRYVLTVSALDNSKSTTVHREFERLFEHYGLPQAIRSDNGSPFAARFAPLGLSRLSAWWVALGIDLDRIRPGHPEENGAHERLHLDISLELEGRIHGDIRDHQEVFDLWRQEFNWERPHEALGMNTPGSIYEKSPRPYEGTPDELEYPSGYIARKIDCSGALKVLNKKIRVTTALRGWTVGLKPTSSHSLEVWFDRLYLGEIDLKTEAFKKGGVKE